MNFDSHPIVVIERLRAVVGDSGSCTFSAYKYSPQSIADERRTFDVPMPKVTRPWLEYVLGALPEGVELALHSNITFGNEVFHIPMVDFATASRAQLPKLNEYLGVDVANSMLWFDSGRSFHGYGAMLVTEVQWRQLMGRLLLANLPNLPPLIDPRWVGHRLIAGYSALRWSWNTNQYMQAPQLADTWWTQH